MTITDPSSLTVPPSPVLEAPPAAPEVAVAYFTARLTFQTDVADVHASLALSDPGFVLIDSRALPGWQQGHIPGALRLPTGDIAARALVELDPRSRLSPTAGVRAATGPPGRRWRSRPWGSGSRR